MQIHNRHNRRFFLGMLVCISIVCVTMLLHQQSYAEWKQDDKGTQYEKEDGSLAEGFTVIDDKKYYFDKDGYLQTGKFFDENSQKYYYADKKGVIKTGTIELKNKFYIADEDGAITTGFVEYEGNRYFFDEAANMVTDWFKSDGKWYYAQENGVVMTGFLTVDGYRYYLAEDGSRVSDTTMEIEGTIYIFNKDGSIDENATTMYPIYQYITEKRKSAGIDAELSMDTKVQACAVLRASDLVNGYQADGSTSLEGLLKNRGVKCAGGYEFSYGGIEAYDMEQLKSDMEQDVNLQQAIAEDQIDKVGLGVYEAEGISYFDVIFIKDTSTEE